MRKEQSTRAPAPRRIATRTALAVSAALVAVFAATEVREAISTNQGGLAQSLQAEAQPGSRTIDQRGIEDRVGSLEVGKDGDLALYDGDPFEYTSHAIGTIVDGVQVSDRVK